MGHCHIEPTSDTFVEELSLAFDFAQALGVEATHIDWCIFARFCAKRGLEALLTMDGTGCGSLAHEAAKGLQRFDAGPPRHYLAWPRRCGARARPGGATSPRSEITKCISAIHEGTNA
jgi:hypothetical protein